MKLYSTFILLVLLALPLCGVAGRADGLLDELNQALAHKERYFKQRLDRIALLTSEFNNHRPADETKFRLGLRIYQEYRSFKYDSAFAYAQRVRQLADQLHSPQKQEIAKLNLAFIDLSSGMFKETFETLASIRPARLDSADKVDFYFTKARSFSDLADYNAGNYYRPGYIAQAVACTDTALRYCRPASYAYWSIQGFRALKRNDVRASRAIYARLLRLPTLTPHQLAITASTAAWVAELSGEPERGFELLTQAAIADVKTATTETVALFKLSDLCYRRGDLKNAYTFINQAQADATYYDSRLRQVQMGSIFSLIESQRINLIEQQRRRLTIYAVATTALVLFVIGFAVVIFRQLRKLQAADALISTINQELQHNNQHLSQLNQELSSLNQRLNEANHIKDEYIGYYFSVSSEYIDKIERFKNLMDKTLTTKQYASTQRIVDSLNIKKERNELFKGFDSVFLKLFPNFVAAFNDLLRPEERIELPEDQLLNTELRIFALIRLGIDDSERISKILGYTISTIYTYKTRVKKKSCYPSEEFEGRVRAIQAA